MGLNYYNLDEETRKYMLEELDISEKDEKIYVSNYLSDRGKEDWLPLLKAACTDGTDLSLATELSRHQRLLVRVQKRKPKGGFTIADVPYTANETLSEGQFNRLYIRAMCRRALATGRVSVRVYRAAERAEERQASIALIGTGAVVGEAKRRARLQVGVSRTEHWPMCYARLVSN